MPANIDSVAKRLKDDRRWHGVISDADDAIFVCDFYDFFAIGECVSGGFESFQVGVAYEDEEQNQGGDGDFQDGATHGGFWLLGNEYVSASYSNARRR